MLIRFNVKNFLSFDERDDGRSEEFSMIAGKARNKAEHLYDDNKLKLLKFSAVFGANASGKSNLVKAMDFMKTTILQGLPKGHTEKYCKTKQSNKEKKSYFEMEILLNGKYYSYGFEVILSQSKFLSEWLVELKLDNKEETIFTRDITNGIFEFGGELSTKDLLKRLNVYADDVRSDGSVLFLSLMNTNKKNFYSQFKSAAILQDLFLWMANSLDIQSPNEQNTNYGYLLKQDDIREVCEIISAFGTGINGFEYTDITFEKILETLPKLVRDDLQKNLESLISELNTKASLLSPSIVLRSPSDLFIITFNKFGVVGCKTLSFSHGKDNILFHMSEESDGTKRLLDLLEILISKEDKTYVIDELDRCLHPSLTYKFVKTYLEIAAERNIQLIVTTHESRLLDFDLLRRDEIWFINKRESGSSDIYSLEEYNTRFDQKVDKAYLEGRYGGVPLFSTIFPIGEA